jgi:hypothetical protein
LDIYRIKMFQDVDKTGLILFGNSEVMDQILIRQNSYQSLKEDVVLWS